MEVKQSKQRENPRAKAPVGVEARQPRELIRSLESVISKEIKPSELIAALLALPAI